MKKHQISVDLVMNFVADQSVVRDKLMGRRVCPCCNRNHNMCHINRDGYFMRAILPKVKPSHYDDCQV